MTDVNDLPILRAIDESMGWVEPDGNSPAATAERLGMRAVIIGSTHGMPAVAWGDPDGVWALPSVYESPLLARSPEFLTFLLGLDLTKDQKRALWEKRYRRWKCSKTDLCACQLCRACQGGGRQ